MSPVFFRGADWYSGKPKLAVTVHTQYDAIIKTASSLCDDSNKLQSAVSEIQKVGESINNQRVGNSQGVPVVYSGVCAVLSAFN